MSIENWTPDADGLHLWTDDEEFVIAKDENDARAVLRDIMLVDAEEASGIEFTMLPDEKPFTFDDGNSVTTKTAAEWCAQEGRGHLCSANY